MASDDNDNVCNVSNESNENDNENVIPRHTPSNPYNYNAAQLAERKKTLKDLAEVYPSLPFAWLEMAYDFEKNTSREEIQKIIHNKLWEKPGKFTPGRNGMFDAEGTREYPSKANKM